MHNHIAHSSNHPRFWRPFLLWLVVVALLMGGCGTEQPHVYRVGILSGLEYFAAITDGFKAGMADLGYIEGQHIIYDVQQTNFDMAAYQRILRQFVADDVDLIVTFPTEAAQEAKVATEGTDIPIIFVLSFTEDTGLVASVPKPGGNITGVRYPGPDIALKRFEVLHELVPQMQRLWVPYQRGYPTVASQLEKLSPMAEEAGITIIEVPADNAAELEKDLKAQATSTEPGMDAILFLSEPLAVTADAFAVIEKFATRHRVPIGGPVTSKGGYGSVLSVDVDSFAAGQQSAALADKIFTGTPAGTIRVLSAESHLQINYSVAEKLGLTVPEGLLKEADEVIH